MGPLARFNLNFNQMAPAARAAAQAVGLLPICANPFKSIVVRSLEVLHACQEALEIINNYDPAPSGATTSAPLATTGFGCTEAPRGICWHRYDLDPSGKVINARIVPPTAQNQKVIEADLRAFAETVATCRSTNRSGDWSGGTQSRPLHLVFNPFDPPEMTSRQRACGL